MVLKAPFQKSFGLLDNIQDIVNSKNGHDIVNSIPWGFVDHDAVTSIIGHRNW